MDPDRRSAVHLAVLAIVEDATTGDLASANVAVERATEAGHRVVAQELAATEAEIRAQLTRWIGQAHNDAVIVVGDHRGATKAALAPLVTEALPGFANVWVARCSSKLVFVLPPSPAAARSAMDTTVLPRLDSRRSDSLTKLIPRFSPAARGKPRTGRNVVKRDRDDDFDPPTKPIDVERLEQQLAMSSADNPTRQVDVARLSEMAARTGPESEDEELALQKPTTVAPAPRRPPPAAAKLPSAIPPTAKPRTPALGTPIVAKPRVEAPPPPPRRPPIQTPPMGAPMRPAAPPAKPIGAAPPPPPAAKPAAIPRGPEPRPTKPASDEAVVLVSRTPAPPHPPEPPRRPIAPTPPVPAIAVPVAAPAPPPAKKWPEVAPSTVVDPEPPQPPPARPPVTTPVAGAPTASPPPPPPRTPVATPAGATPIVAPAAAPPVAPPPAPPPPVIATPPRSEVIAAPQQHPIVVAPPPVVVAPPPQQDFAYAPPPMRWDADGAGAVPEVMSPRSVRADKTVMVLRRRGPSKGVIVLLLVAAACAVAAAVVVVTHQGKAPPDAGVTLAQVTTTPTPPAPAVDPPDAAVDPEIDIEPPKDAGTTRPPPPPPTMPPTRPIEPAHPLPPGPPPAAGCDEVSCVLDRYARPCCERFKPADGGFDPKRTMPDRLDRTMVKEGVERMKPRVIACGEKNPAKGTVKISLTVGPDGSVSDASVQEAPDPGLGECVATALRKATFGKTINGSTFVYPFAF